MDQAAKHPRARTRRDANNNMCSMMGHGMISSALLGDHHRLLVASDVAQYIYIYIYTEMYSQLLQRREDLQ
jgi:hypothetical protein